LTFVDSTARCLKFRGEIRMRRLKSAIAVSLVLAAGAALSPSRAAPPVEDYGKLPAMDMVKLSSSGERYAFIADDGAARRIYVATTDNKPLLIVPLGKTKVWSLAWAGEDYVLVHWSQTVGVGPDFTVSRQELSGATVLNLRTHSVLQVFANQPTTVDPVVEGFYGTAQIGGRWYGYFSGYTLQNDKYNPSPHANEQVDGDLHVLVPDLYRVDLETGAVKKAATGPGPDTQWLVGPHGEVVARLEFLSKSGAWKLMTGEFGGRALAAGTNKKGPPDLLSLSRTADAVLISTDESVGTGVQEVPLAGGPAKEVIDPRSNAGPIVDSTTRLWIGSQAQGDEPLDTLFSPLSEARLKGARNAFPGYRVALKSASDDFGKMIVYTDGGDDSGTYWIVDIATGSAKVVGGAYPSVAEKDVGPVRMVDWKAADGLVLRGVLTLPPGREARNLPIVVMPHGGPWARDYPAFDFWAQAFASRGYAVFQPNFRGSTGYGDDLYNAGRGEIGRKMQTDISDGLAELVRQGIVDPKRACIVGASYGGYAALAGVTVQHGLYRCAVSYAGVSDFAAQLWHTEQEEGGSDTPGMRIWKEFLGIGSSWGPLNAISPIKLADHADAPILLIHGKDDTVVPISETDGMERALNGAGKPVERLTLDGADHWLKREDTRQAMIKASVAFVEKYNPPDPPPAAVAAAH
jgi:acetyl esterase/lipase